MQKLKVGLLGSLQSLKVGGLVTRACRMLLCRLQSLSFGLRFNQKFEKVGLSGSLQ